jgi:shikimate kinase / 3-dehydroquinate synthase
VHNLYLTGLPGVGKSTLARLVAPRLGLLHIDTDQEIERRVGMPIAQYWRDHGEQAFRGVERTVVLEALANPAPKLVAFGGGALLARDVRHQAIRSGTLIHLRAPQAVLEARLAVDAKRPILQAAEGLPARLVALLQARAEAYAESHAEIWTDDDIDTLCDTLCAKYTQNPLLMPLGTNSYPIDIVEGEPRFLADALASMGPSSIVVVTDTNVTVACKESLDALLSTLSIPRTVVTLLPGEVHKTVSSVQTIWDSALLAEIDRDSIVVGFGGGVVTDLAGFTASTLLRGLRWVAVPTTSLAMIDASVGGKTGFDTTHGKNLIGTFHQPSRVVIDTTHLSTLPSRELRCGFAEAVKIAALFDAALLDRIAESASELTRGAGNVAEIVRRCVALKIDVVCADEREKGARALLNAGHTVGHALETAGGYEALQHGEAVAIGLVLETQLAERKGWAEAGTANKLRHVLAALGFGCTASPELLMRALPRLGHDKKRVGGELILPIVANIGQGTLVRVPVRELETLLRA